MIKVEVFSKNTGVKHWTEYHKTEEKADEAIEQMKMNVFNPDFHFIKKMFAEK